MPDRVIYCGAETGTLSGTTITLSGSVIAGMLASQLFADALSDGDTVAITVADASDPTIFAIYSGVPFTASGTTLDLSSGTLIASNGTLGSSVNVLSRIPESFARYDIAQSWTASQALNGGVTGDAETISSSSGAITISLDGKAKAWSLTESATVTLSTPSGATWASALIVIEDDGSSAITWPATIKLLSSQSLPGTSGKYAVYVVWTPDGGTTYFLSGAGSE